MNIEALTFDPDRLMATTKLSPDQAQAQDQPSRPAGPLRLAPERPIEPPKDMAARPFVASEQLRDNHVAAVVNDLQQVDREQVPLTPLDIVAAAGSGKAL